MDHLSHQNIENLTALWRKIGERAGGYSAGAEFDCCVLDHSDWPNRLWFHQDVTAGGIAAAKKELLSRSTRLVVPYWAIYQRRADGLFQATGFEPLFEQVGMSLRLTQAYAVTETLVLKQVSTNEMALLWETVFRQAFGYTISHELLLPDYGDIRFLLAFRADKPVGTCILHNSPQTVMGIHGMGIIPEMRGKGFAEELMRIILNQAVEQGVEWATLQASAMGKGLYLKLGFQEQFVMRNYGLPLPA